LAKVAAVVPAAGSGRRMGAGADTKKQFMVLDGVPVVGHALNVLENSRVQSIVVVVGSGEVEHCRSAVVEKMGLKKVTAIVTGGKERQDSVYNGLLALAPDTGIVVVHDGVRPLLRLEELERVIESAETYGAATLAVPAKDTVKVSGGDSFVAGTFPRDSLWLTQTPQAFRYEIILKAHREARKRNYTGTDDAGLVELLGMPVKIVPGSYKNIKITTPEDLIMAAALLKSGD